MRITVDKHTWRALLDGKANRVVRHGPEPRARVAPVFRYGDRTSVGRLRILGVAPSTMGAVMPDGDVKAALEHGAPTTVEFKRRWLAHHDRFVKRLTGDQVAALSADEIAALWEPWTTLRVWSLQVELDKAQRDRFLRERPSSDRTRLTDDAGFRRQVSGGGDLARGYTENPALGLSGEQAAVDDVTLARFAAEAEDRDAARRRRDLAELQQAIDNVRWLDADTRHVRVIRRQIELMANRGAA